MIRVGILGMGMMGWLHAGQILKLPGAELVAIADSTPERLIAKDSVVGNITTGDGALDLSGVARHTDPCTLIADDGIDIVDVCLPTPFHARYTVEALQAGHHVLCEKPMALTLQDADQMIAAAKQHDRLLMVAQCIRFWPEYRFLRDQVRGGALGSLLSLDLWRTGARPTWSWQNWFLDPQRSGGPLYDLHIHDVDYTNYLLGLPDRVQASARRSPATGAYDVVHALFTYDDGPQVHIHGGWSVAEAPFRAGYEAWFERGLIRFDGLANPPLMVYDSQGSACSPEIEQGNAYYNEIAYFVDCVEHGQPPVECPPESARDSLGLVKKEIAASESGQSIPGRN
ncbi:MAG: Gfo/Idh/MocA family oxidoreductase [Anaerolineales bacterium]|nr:Gfo/Idh/MocA family oxidoreductase [Anaerolineales bacterium]